MRTPIALACCFALTLSACGTKGPSAAGPSEPIPYSSIDTAAWKSELAALPDVRANPDVDQLYELTLDDCKADVSDIALRLTLRGANPAIDRIDMKYVCPSQVHKIDDALASNQDAMSKLNEACALAPNQRTQDQRDMVDAVGCS